MKTYRLSHLARKFVHDGTHCPILEKCLLFTFLVIFLKLDNISKFLLIVDHEYSVIVYCTKYQIYWPIGWKDILFWKKVFILQNLNFAEKCVFFINQWKCRFAFDIWLYVDDFLPYFTIARSLYLVLSEILQVSHLARCPIMA